MHRPQLACYQRQASFAAAFWQAFPCQLQGLRSLGIHSVHLPAVLELMTLIASWLADHVCSLSN